MKIKICKKFVKTNKLKNKLKIAFPEAIIKKECINLCKVCKHQPVAKVQGTRFKAKRIAELLSQIRTSSSLTLD